MQKNRKKSEKITKNDWKIEKDEYTMCEKYRCWLEKNDEKMLAVITKISANSSGLMNLWVEKKYLAEPLENWWSIETQVCESNGNAYRAYNPQIIARKKSPEKMSRGSYPYDHVINFEWMLPATEENFYKILNQIGKDYMSGRNKLRRAK